MTEVGPPREFWISQWKLGSSETPIIRRAEAHDVKDQISGRKKRGSKKEQSPKGKTFSNIKLPKTSSVKGTNLRSKKRDLLQLKLKMNLVSFIIKREQLLVLLPKVLQFLPIFLLPLLIIQLSLKFCLNQFLLLQNHSDLNLVL